MASGNLPFEFHSRWPMLSAMLFGNLNATQQDAANDLERNMRDLEDYLATLSGGGTLTAGSLVIFDRADTAGSGLTLTPGGATEVLTSQTITAPSTAGFTYQLECYSLVQVVLAGDGSGTEIYPGFNAWFGLSGVGDDFEEGDYFHDWIWKQSFGTFVANAHIGLKPQLTAVVAAGSTSTVTVNANSTNAYGSSNPAQGVAHTVCKLWAIPA